MLKGELIYLFERDLDRFIDNLQEIPGDRLWMQIPGIHNSCGVLAQHLVGNLNHFIGAALGKTGYVRDREAEFTPREQSREELIISLKKLKKVIRESLDKLSEKDWEAEYPERVPYDTNVRGFIIHLYGHLNYHMGQLNYLRRILVEKSEN